jgi:hypothetical protein
MIFSNEEFEVHNLPIKSDIKVGETYFQESKIHYFCLRLVGLIFMYPTLASGVALRVLVLQGRIRHGNNFHHSFECFRGSPFLLDAVHFQVFH